MLHDVSFTVEPGRRIALIGPPGAGKTIATELLARHYLPDSGTVEIFSDSGSVDTAQVNSDAVYQVLTVVPDTPYLFAGTLRENIAFARPQASDAEIERVAQAAHINFVADLPQGWDTKIGERGHNLSGGQAQRVALARAFLARPQILVLDDATSAIDASTEADIFAAVNQLLPDTTMVLVAHRSSTLEQVDHIAIFEAGEVTGYGTKAELLATHPRFAELMDIDMRQHPEVEKLVLDSPELPEPDAAALWPQGTSAATAPALGSERDSHNLSLAAGGTVAPAGPAAR